MDRYHTILSQCLLLLAGRSCALTARLLDRASALPCVQGTPGLRYEVGYARHRADELAEQIEHARSWEL